MFVGLAGTNLYQIPRPPSSFSSPTLPNVVMMHHQRRNLGEAVCSLQPMEKMPTKIVPAIKCHFCLNRHRQNEKMPPKKRPQKDKRPAPPPEVVEEPPKVDTPESLLQSTKLPNGPSLETVFSSTGIPVLQHKFQKALMGGSYGTP